MKGLISCTVTVMVSNLDKAIKFYVETLGLELKNRYGENYAEIQCPGLTIGLHPVEDEVNWGNNLSIGFGVNNFDDLTKSLMNKDVKLEIKQDGWIRLAHFKDLDNNHLYLAELKE